MITITRRIEFDAAHRVMRHESKCKHLHGHRYAVLATFTAPELDALGRVVDFGEIKTRLGEWVDANWDHATILHREDAALGSAISKETGQEIYYLGQNPTAENMASHLLEKVCPQLFASLGVTCTAIELFETPNCSATASL